MTTRRRPGRPSRYTPALGKAICRQVALGHTLSAIAAEPGMPCRDTVYRWRTDGDHPEFEVMFARALTIRAQTIEDDILHLVDNEAPGPETERRLASAMLEHIRLRLDARKIHLARLMPRPVTPQNRRRAARAGEVSR